jgi:hypothetical protein
VAARAFAFEDPNYAAGVYSEVMARRWRNTTPSAPRCGRLKRRYFVDGGSLEQIIARGPGLSAHVEVHDWEFGGRHQRAHGRW